MKQILMFLLVSLTCCPAFSRSVNNADSVTKPNEQFLEEVVVTADITPIKLSKGGINMKIKGSPLSDAGTCFDVLAQMPGIRTDEGNIEIIGRGSPQIYINGRRMLDRSELERISSKDIQSVEILSNPGAKYGADVKSVILIKTVRKQGDGLSGSVEPFVTTKIIDAYNVFESAVRCLELPDRIAENLGSVLSLMPYR